MTNSYNSSLDVISRDFKRAAAPGRYAYAATAAAAELPVYGKLRIYNGNNAPATVTVVPVESTDDAAADVLTVPANSVCFEQIIVRRITAIDAGVIVHVVA
jgi:hypothetical protein